MEQTARKSARPLLLLMVLLLSLGCGQSENIGWADRERPDPGDATGSATGSEDAAQPPATPLDQGGHVRKEAEYRELANALEPLRQLALAEPDIAMLSNELNSALEAEVSSGSAQLRALIERRRGIERRLREAQEAGRPIPAEEQQVLAVQYRNIQAQLGPAFSELLRRPEYAERLGRLQAALFAKMRELGPQRSAEIDRMQALGAELF